MNITVTYYASALADQGLTGTRTLKGLATSIGSSKQATIVLSHTSSGNTTTYSMSQSVTLTSNITLKIEKGAVLSIAAGKILTINGTLEAGEYQIFSGAGTVSGLKEATPYWFGGTPDYSAGTGSDNAAAIIAAGVAAANGIVTIPYGAWGVSSAVTIPGTCDLQMPGYIVYMGVENITVLTVGTASNYVMHRKIEINVALGSAHAGDWASEDLIGAKIINAYRSSIRVIRAGDHLITGGKGFGIGLQMEGNTKGSYYNNIELLHLGNNKVSLNLLGIGVGGYFNENYFYGGNFTNDSTCNTTLDKIAIRVAGGHNVFVKPSFEHGGGASTGIPTCLDISGSGNRVIDARDEILQKGILAIINDGNDNDLEFMEGSGNMIYSRVYTDNSSLQKNTVRRRTKTFTHETTQPVYSARNIGDKFGASDDTHPYIPSVSWFTLDGIGSISRSLVKYDNAIQNISGVVVAGAYIYTDSIKHFVLNADFDVTRGNGTTGQLYVICYDAAGTALTGVAPLYVNTLRNLSTREFVSYTLGAITGYVSFNHASENVYPFEFRVHADVKKIWVGVGLPAGGAALRSFEILAHPLFEYGKASITSGYSGNVDDVNHYNSAIPTRGVYKAGEIVYNSSPASAEPILWASPSSGAAYKATRANTTGVTTKLWYKWSSGDTVWECVTTGTTAGSAPDISTSVIGDVVTDGTAVFRKMADTSTVFVVGPVFP